LFINPACPEAMKRDPLRLLVAGYGLAAAAAVAARWQGLGLTTAALGFWIGGALLTFGLAVLIAWLRSDASVEEQADVDAADAAAYAAALARWEQDRLADAAPAREAAAAR
jgi:hypothetical protein